MLEKNNYTDKNTEYKNKENNWNTSRDILEWMNFEWQEYIWKIWSLLYWTKDWLLNAAYYTDYPKDCDDWSTLFTIVNINWKNTLVKMWAWEFNIECFNQKDKNKDQEHVERYKHIKWLWQTPIPLFVVSQRNSYLANEEKRKNMWVNPKKYLEDYALIVVPKKKSAYSTDKNDVDFNKIHIPSLEEAKKKINNTIIDINISKKNRHYLKKIMQELQSISYEEFSKKFSNKVWNKNNPKSQVFQKIKYLLENMIPETWNKKQIYDLIKKYNTNKLKFI